MAGKESWVSPSTHFTRGMANLALWIIGFPIKVAAHSVTKEK